MELPLVVEMVVQAHQTVLVDQRLIMAVAAVAAVTQLIVDLAAQVVLGVVALEQ
jgi:hypothetical protein